jgi:hypothetical protein
MLGLKRKSSPPATRADLEASIERLTAANRSRPSRETERELLRLRHRLGLKLIDEAPSDPRHPEPAASLPEGGDLPEFTPDQLSPELVRAAILRDGCVLVRGLAPRDAALEMAAEIDRAFAERETALAGGRAADGYFEPFVPERGGEELTEVRTWVRMGGGHLAGDAPRLAFRMLELFAAAGVPDLVRGYLGEPPLLSLEKTTLRKADPSVGGAWHQDGRFMGPVRAMNLWLSLSRCGDESPGLDIVPRRLPELVAAGTEGTYLDYQVSDAVATEAAGGARIVRPIFEPGDALLFDELFLHQTGSDPAMTRPRYAIESWFFGGSAFPAYAPIAV